MGDQIALNAAIKGFDVILNDTSEQVLDNANKWAEDYLEQE